jgi:hypothetical protein
MKYSLLEILAMKMAKQIPKILAIVFYAYSSNRLLTFEFVVHIHIR